MNSPEEWVEEFVITVSTILRDSIANNACLSSIVTLTKTSKAHTHVNHATAIQWDHAMMEFAIRMPTQKKKQSREHVTAREMLRDVDVRFVRKVSGIWQLRTRMDARNVLATLWEPLTISAATFTLENVLANAWLPEKIVTNVCQRLMDSLKAAMDALLVIAMLEDH